MRKWIVGFTLIFITLLAVDATPGLRGGAGWRWPYEKPENWPAIVALAVVLVVYVGGVWLLQRTTEHRKGEIYLAPTIRTRRNMILLWAFVGSVAVSLAVVGIQGNVLFHLFTRTVSPVQTGASALAVRVFAEEGANSALDRWPDVMREASAANLIHFTTSPPGQPLAHYAAARVFESLPGFSRVVSMALRPYQCSDYEVMRYSRGELVSAGLGMLMPVWAALAVIPLYAAGRMLYGDSHLALKIALWWPLIPVISLFAPTWNTLYPFLCIASFALLLAGLRRNRGVGVALFCIAAGGVMSITTFLNFAVLPALLLFGVFAVGYAALTPKSPLPSGEGTSKSAPTPLQHRLRFVLLAGVYFGIGLSSVWIMFALVTGLTPLDLLRVTFDEHSALVQNPYLPWLLLNPYDVLLFVGWPVAGLFIGGVWLAVRKVTSDASRSRLSPFSFSLSPINLLALAMLLTFLLVDVAGVAQGETARILSFYAPFLLLIAGGALVTRPRGWDLPLMMTQGAMVLVMAAVMPVVPQDLNPQPTGPRSDVQILGHLDALPVNATFSSAAYDGTFVLEGHRFVADLGNQVITLETIWRGLDRTERPYQFEVIAHAENEIDGEIVSEPFRWLPQDGNYLTTCWRAGDAVHDVILVPLPPVSMPVVWTLEVRAVDERTGDVALVTLSDGTVSDHATLGPVSYP